MLLPLYFAIPIEKDKWNGSFDFKLNCRTLYLTRNIHEVLNIESVSTI